MVYLHTYCKPIVCLSLCLHPSSRNDHQAQTITECHSQLSFSLVPSSSLTLSPPCLSPLPGLQQDLMRLLASQPLFYRWPRPLSLSASPLVSPLCASVMCSCTPALNIYSYANMSSWLISPHTHKHRCFAHMDHLFTCEYSDYGTLVCFYCFCACG